MHWLRAWEQANWVAEEATLVTNEMSWTVSYFRFQEQEWITRSLAMEDFLHGHTSYALQQASMYWQFAEMSVDLFEAVKECYALTHQHLHSSSSHLYLLMWSALKIRDAEVSAAGLITDPKDRDYHNHWEWSSWLIACGLNLQDQTYRIKVVSSGRQSFKVSESLLGFQWIYTWDRTTKPI